MQGRTGICIFDGIMDRWLYTDILEHTLLPFVRDVYDTNHRFMQDNNPKHTSNHGKEFMDSNAIYWWKTPAESPDFKPNRKPLARVKGVHQTRSEAENKSRASGGDPEVLGNSGQSKMYQVHPTPEKGYPKSN